MNRKPVVAVFFPICASLKSWQAAGVLKREMQIFQALRGSVARLYFFSYGDASDTELVKFIPSNSTLVYNKYHIPPLLYSILIPFLYRSYLRNISHAKSIQINGAWTALLAKLLYKKKLVLRVGYEPSQNLKNAGTYFIKQRFYSTILRILYQHADTIIVTSQKIKEYIHCTFHCREEKIIIIPNYVDTNIFRRGNKKATNRRVCYIGRLSREKNVGSLVDASEGKNWELIIIGDGPLRSALECRAKRKKIKVQFLGILPNQKVCDVLDKCSLFVLPSYYEGNPKALLEAMSCGLACVGTNVDGIRDIIIHKKNGYLCDTSKYSLRHAMEECLSNPHLLEKMGKNAREGIIQCNDLAIIARKEAAIYRI